MFDRLGVFAGTFDAPTRRQPCQRRRHRAASTCSTRSRAWSPSRWSSPSDVDGTTRYQLLETLRQYARERLDEAGAADDWRRRHAEHYAAFAEDAGTALLGPDEIACAAPRRSTDLDNLRAAVTWALDRGTTRIRASASGSSRRSSTKRRCGGRPGVGAWAGARCERADLMTPRRALQRPLSRWAGTCSSAAMSEGARRSALLALEERRRTQSAHLLRGDQRAQLGDLDGAHSRSTTTASPGRRTPEDEFCLGERSTPRDR